MNESPTDGPYPAKPVTGTTQCSWPYIEKWRQIVLSFQKLSCKSVPIILTDPLIIRVTSFL